MVYRGTKDFLKWNGLYDLQDLQQVASCGQIVLGYGVSLFFPLGKGYNIGIQIITSNINDRFRHNRKQKSILTLECCFLEFS